jgi:hypothetical protein
MQKAVKANSVTQKIIFNLQQIKIIASQNYLKAMGL